MAQRPSPGLALPNPDPLPSNDIEEPLNNNDQQPDENDQESVYSYDQRPDDVLKEKLSTAEKFKAWLTRRTYGCVNRTADDEQSFNIIAARKKEIYFPINFNTSVILCMKWVLGNSLLRGHACHQRAGILPSALIFTVTQITVSYATIITMQNQYTLCRRTGKARLHYDEIGQASMELFPNPKIQRMGRIFGIVIFIFCYISITDLTLNYIKITALYLKQSIEDVPIMSDKSLKKGLFTFLCLGLCLGLPPINAYLRLILLAVTAVCLVRHVNWLRPLALFGNAMLVIFFSSSIYYLVLFNPTFKGLVLFKNPPPVTYLIICAYGMRYQSNIIPWTAFANQMTNINECPTAVIVVTGITFTLQMLAWIVSYVAFLDEGAPHITFSFPQGRISHFAGASMGLMTFSSISLAYWITFDPVFKFLKQYHSKKYLLQFEYLYRGCLIASTITALSFFPRITGSTSTLANDCHAFTSYVFPGLIDLLVNWSRPGLGRYYWRLWLDLYIIIMGLTALVANHLNR